MICNITFKAPEMSENVEKFLSETNMKMQVLIAFGTFGYV